MSEYNLSREEEIKRQYGADITKLDKGAEKTKKKIRKANKFLEKLLKVLLTIIILSLIFFIFYVFRLWAYLNEYMDINVVKTLNNMYQKNFEIEGTVETYEDGSIKYLVKTKDKQEFEFFVVKRYSQMSEDYLSRTLKYYFEKWDNPDKNKFNVKSNTNEKGLLNYQVYMEIDSVDKVDEAYDLYYDFVNKTGNNYINYWGIYVVYNGTNHQLTINKDRTLEENKQNVKDNINFIEGHKNK